MAISITTVKCPECGASLEVEEGRQQCFCSYCGAKIIISNENEYIYRHIDEAELKKAETSRMVKMRELDMQEKGTSSLGKIRTILTVIWIVLSLVVLGLTIYQWAFIDSNEGFLMMFYLCGPIVAGGAYLIFKVIPDKENDKRLISNGGIRFPKNLDRSNYEVTVNTLLRLGYTNVNSYNMHDIKIGLLSRPGEVESVSVNGAIPHGGKVYPSDSDISITYHGK